MLIDIGIFFAEEEVAYVEKQQHLTCSFLNFQPKFDFETETGPSRLYLCGVFLLFRVFLDSFGPNSVF